MKILIHQEIIPGTKRIGFWCPGCDTMMTVCPDRWNWNGDTDKPTLSPSILQTLGPFPDGRKEVCHCFVRDGQIEFLGDCTHDKRGVMPLPELESVIDLHTAEEGNVWWVRKESKGQQ